MAPRNCRRLLALLLLVAAACAASARHVQASALDVALRQGGAPAPEGNATDPGAPGAANETAAANDTTAAEGGGGAGAGPEGDGIGGFPPAEKPAAFNDDCTAYARIHQLSQGRVMEAWHAFFVMAYFLGLASLLFGGVAAVRTQVLGARGRPALVACLVFGCGLAVAATLALIMRTVLDPVDASELGVFTKDDENGALLYCQEQLGDRWPTKRKWNDFLQEWMDVQVSGNPYLGKPPRDTWVFWLFVVACYAGAVVLLLSIIRVRLEDRMPRHDPKVVDDDPPPPHLPVHDQA